MTGAMRRPVRALSTVLIVAGALMLCDAALTLLWQEPVSAVYAKVVQGRLGDDLAQLEQREPSTIDLAALGKLATERRRMAFLARRLQAQSDGGAAVGRVKIGRIGADYVLVDGTAGGDLRKGPGIYDEVPFPGAPGTTAIAGHRTTYAAPFRRIDKLRAGDDVIVEMPYGRFTYEVERSEIVDPSEVSVIRRVKFDRLVLSACHPLYSAAERIVVFARLIASEARGAARL